MTIFKLAWLHPFTVLSVVAGIAALSACEAPPSPQAQDTMVEDVVLGPGDLASPPTTAGEQDATPIAHETIEQCLTRFSAAWRYSEEQGLDVAACPPEVRAAYAEWSLTQTESIRVNQALRRVEDEGGDTREALSAVYVARNRQSDAEQALRNMLDMMGHPG